MGRPNGLRLCCLLASALLAALLGRAAADIHDMVSRKRAEAEQRQQELLPPAEQMGFQSLKPWMFFNTEDVPLVVPRCVVAEASPWGVGLSLNTLLWGTALMRTHNPGVHVWYNHSASPYQCSSTDGAVDAWFAPGGKVISAGQPPAGCERWEFATIYHLVSHRLHTRLRAVITEKVKPEQEADVSLREVLDGHMLLAAAYQALCPVVADWWQLSPAAQAAADRAKRAMLGDIREPVIAIHARGRSTDTDLGRFVGSEAHDMPMADGMHHLKRTHPGIGTANPVCIIFVDKPGPWADGVRASAKAILGCKRIEVRAPPGSGNTMHGWEGYVERGGPAARCAATTGYLTDIELMAQANFFVGNHHTTVDTLVLYLRKCKYFYDQTTATAGHGPPHLPFWV